MVLAGTLLATGACAYFNTFYNAQAHFTKAERIESNRDAEATTVSATAIAEYDLAIEKCNKVIQNHSNSRWVDDALLLMGRAQFGKRSFESALSTFNALSNMSDTDLREEALFWAGRAYYELDRNEEGRQTFERLMAEFPRSNRIGLVLETQARALVADGEAAAALSAYRRIVREFPGTDVRQEALFELGELYMEVGHFDSAYAAYEEVTRTADTFGVRLEARVLTGDALFREKRYEDALGTYLTALDLGQELPIEERAPIEVKIADCLTELGRLPEAIARYEEVAESYAGTVHAAEALFQIGFIHERRYGDYVKAVEVYTTASSQQGGAARSVFTTEAADRLRDLQKLIDRGITSAESGTGDAEADGALFLAEQFLFQEGDTTKAVSQYRTVMSEYPDDEISVRALYALAWLAERQGAPQDSVVALHDQVLARFPGTQQAIQSGAYLTRHGLQDRIPEGALDPIVEEEVADPGDSLSVPGDSLFVPGDSLSVPGDSLFVPGDSLSVPGDSLSVPGDSLGAPADSGFRPDGLLDRDRLREAAVTGEDSLGLRAPGRDFPTEDN